MVRNQTGWSEKTDMKTKMTCLAFAAIVVIMIIPSCEKDPASSHRPDVVNKLDNFHFQIADVRDHDTLLTYYWRTEGTSANINQLASITGGQASLRIVGPDSTETYQTDFAQNGDFRSGSSESGIWKITIRLASFSGMLDFRVQRR